MGVISIEQGTDRDSQVDAQADEYLAAALPGWYPGISAAEYSRHIAGFDPLPAASEEALVKQVRAALAGWVNLPGDSAALAEELRGLVADGEQAKLHLIRANAKLVVSIAKQYASYGVPLMDLVQAGNVGLLRAVAAFVQHPAQERLSAFCQFWIRHEIEHDFGDDHRNLGD